MSTNDYTLLEEIRDIFRYQHRQGYDMCCGRSITELIVGMMQKRPEAVGVTCPDCGKLYHFTSGISRRHSQDDGLRLLPVEVSTAGRPDVTYLEKASGREVHISHSTNENSVLTARAAEIIWDKYYSRACEVPEDPYDSDELPSE